MPQTNVTFFAGRDEDLAKVHELLQKNQRVAVSAFVKGMGGVGKSELALQYALRHLLTDYSGGICWLRGNEGTLPTQLQDFVQVQLGETMPDGLDSGEKLAGHCWRRLSERVEGQMLVVLDDVKDYGNVEPFLPTLDGKFRVLVTTRLGLGNAMQQYTLDVLMLAAAVDLLKSFLPEADPRRGNDGEIEKLCEWLGRLPLAIELVGRYLARKPDLSIAKMQERLNEKKLQQDALTDTQRMALAEMTAKLNVAAAFDLSWQELSEGAQRLACLLSLFALAPIHWQWVIDAMSDVDEEELEACRDDELLNLHLLERKQQGVYELHQLLREYFHFQLKQHPEWQALRQQVAISLLNISKGIGQTITIDQVKEVTPAIPHLEMLGSELLDDIPNPEEDVIWTFCGIARFYGGQGLYASALIPYQNCLNETESRLGADHPSVATSINNLALLYYSQGKYSKAEPFYLRSLEISERQLGADHPSVATSLNNLALLYESQGKYSEAEPLYLRSLEIRERQLGVDYPDVATSLNNLAELYRIQGKYSEAELLYLRSLEIRELQLGADHPDVAQSFNNLALLYDSQGKYNEAESLYVRSLEIMERQLGVDHPDVASSLNNLALLYDSQRKYSEAELLYLRSLSIRERQLGADHPDVAQSLSNLAALYHNTQRHPEALQSIQRAIQIYEQKLGTEHPDTQNALSWLQTIQDAM
ncbi:MAG: tetratricopeptide repeat protein [Pseudanabaena frigida]|uniref:Tetratricopeptide repeat protein n=1 Tax=Pseudanabaena frigida TaxID=945775 RepID=A0A2W4Y5L4_9CYAN|nr:MAG: tetratricopeptide repeat protein [Pseudanabaena frigida]